jgi:hypothetical protein
MRVCSIRPRRARRLVDTVGTICVKLAVVVETKTCSTRGFQLQRPLARN